MPSYADLVHEHHATVYRVALGVLRDSHAAEDVAQDVFLSFLEDPGALDRAENLRAFVCRTSLNRALDVRKAGKRRAVRESAFNERRENMDPVQAAFRSELREKVAGLSEDQRQAVDLHYFQGLTLREAGIALEIPEGTVSSRINAALGYLRAALGTAAFAGLLAMLESELHQCAAQDAVPAELSKRLLQLRPRAGSRPVPASSAGWPSSSETTPSGSSSFRRKAGLAVLSVLLLGIFFLQPPLFRQTRRPEAKTIAPGEVASAKTIPTPAMPDPDPRAATPVPADDRALLERSGFVVEYFNKGKICVDECKVPDPVTLEQFIEGPGGHIFGRPPAIPCFEKPGPLKDVTVGEFGSFSRWLEGEQTFARAPRVWVKVKYRKSGDDFECVEVLERDELSRAWLEGWRELARVNRALQEEADREPGQDKRLRLLAVQDRLIQAIDSTRAARSKGARAGWCREQERSWASASAALLRRMGCGRELPAFPSESILTELALQAANPAALRDEVLAKFGEDALEESALFVVPSQKPDDTSCNPEWFRISKLAAMSAAEFDALRTRIASVSRQQRAEAMKQVRRFQDRAETPSPRAEALGIHGAQLEDFDAERLSLESGLEVKSVDDGSAAAKAGLRVGDVLWKVMARAEGQVEPPKPIDGGEQQEVPAEAEFGMLVRNLGWLDYLLENEEKTRPGEVKFLVVRGGEVVTVILER